MVRMVTMVRIVTMVGLARGRCVHYNAAFVVVVVLVLVVVVVVWCEAGVHYNGGGSQIPQPTCYFQKQVRRGT